MVETDHEKWVPICKSCTPTHKTKTNKQTKQAMNYFDAHLTKSSREVDPKILRIVRVFL